MLNKLIFASSAVAWGEKTMPEWFFILKMRYIGKSQIFLYNVKRQESLDRFHFFYRRQLILG